MEAFKTPLPDDKLLYYDTFKQLLIAHKDNLDVLEAKKPGLPFEKMETVTLYVADVEDYVVVLPNSNFKKGEDGVFSGDYSLDKEARDILTDVIKKNDRYKTSQFTVLAAEPKHPTEDTNLFRIILWFSDKFVDLC